MYRKSHQVRFVPSKLESQSRQDQSMPGPKRVSVGGEAVAYGGRKGCLIACAMVLVVKDLQVLFVEWKELDQLENPSAEMRR